MKEAIAAANQVAQRHYPNDPFKREAVASALIQKWAEQQTKKKVW